MATTTVVALTHSFDRLKTYSVNKRREMATELANWFAGAAGGDRPCSQLVVADHAVAATGTFTFASMAAGSVVAVNGVEFLAITGSSGALTGASGNQFNLGANDTAAAANLAASINASVSKSIAGVVTATAATGVVTVTPVLAGNAGNAVEIEDRGIRASGTVTISSGSGSVTITINGVTFTKTWATSDTVTAAAFVTSINASANALVAGFITAFSVAGVVTVVSSIPDILGNSITLAAGGTGMTASGARLTGASAVGVAAVGTITISSGSGVITAVINGVTAGSVTWASSDTATAAALAAACQLSASALVRLIVDITSAAGVVIVRAVAAGIGGNAITLATTGTGSTASGARLTGGAAPTLAGPSGPFLTGGTQDAPSTFTM